MSIPDTAGAMAVGLTTGRRHRLRGNGVGIPPGRERLGRSGRGGWLRGPEDHERAQHGGAGTQKADEEAREWNQRTGQRHVQARPQYCLILSPLTPPVLARRNKDLGTLLQERWPERAALDLASAVHHLVTLVQVPPRGVWGAGGQATWAAIGSWLDRPLDPNPSVDEVVLRNLAAFGPASAADVRT